METHQDTQHIIDVMDIEKTEEQQRILEKEYKELLRISGRTVYRYLVEGRRAIVPAEIANAVRIPEVIENYPEWNVANGRVAGESLSDWYGIFDAIDRGESGRMEVIFQRMGGEKRRGRVTYSTILNDAGEPYSAIVSYKDITDQYERDRLQSLDIGGLLQVSKIAFPEILSINLTKGSYRIIQYYDAATVGTPREGRFEEMLRIRLPHVAQEDRQAFQQVFSVENYMEMQRQGKETVQLTYRRNGKDGVWHWMETIAMRQMNPYDDDILIMAVSRNVDKQKADEEILRRALEATSEELEEWRYYNGLCSDIFPGLMYVDYGEGQSSPFHVGMLSERLGCAPDELALCVGERIHPDDRESLKIARLEAESKSRDSFRAEYRAVNRLGGIAWISNHAVRFTDRGGRTGYVYFLTDTTREHSLMDDLRLALEENRLAIEQVGKIVCTYDIKTKTLVQPKMYAIRLGRQKVLTDFPDCLRQQRHLCPYEETLTVLEEMYAAIQRGESTGSCEGRFPDKTGADVWLRYEFVTLLDDDGKPNRAVIAVDDVTGSHEQSMENQRLRENERIFRMVAQHSDRSICYYDINTRLAHAWDMGEGDDGQLPFLYRVPYSEELVDHGGLILPESVQDTKQMFEGIHAGLPYGEAKLHIKVSDGRRRWFHFKYSSIVDEGRPVLALISYQDITDQYEREKSYLRFVQSMEEGVGNGLSYIECDLTTDLLEKRTRCVLWDEAPEEGESWSDFYDTVFNRMTGPDFTEARRIFSSDYLLGQYACGNRNLEKICEFKGRGGRRMWLQVRTELIEDPYSGHIKAFFALTDVTAEQEELQDVRQRAELDGMTGLYNRGTGEERIRNLLAKHKEKGGILIVLDLDDLKGINDRLGHEQGDRAIRSIAGTLKHHFRANDIIVRAGGDEFIIFLPGAGQSVNSVSLSLASLLRKVSGIVVGERDERKIHCSAGCAVELPGEDSFDSLYRRADLALYHVKRRGKNNFAFYTPAMIEEDFQFNMDMSVPRLANSLRGENLRQLLGAISGYFQVMISFNLTSNEFHILEAEQEEAEALPLSGSIDAFWNAVSGRIHPDDRQDMEGFLSERGLLSAYESGRGSIRRDYDYRINGSQYEKVEIVVTFYKAENGDLGAFALFHRYAKSGKRTGETENGGK